MARPHPRRERIEPVLERPNAKADDAFDLRLGEGDRFSAGAGPKPKKSRRPQPDFDDNEVEDAEFVDLDERAQPKPRRRRAPAKKKARGRARGRSGGSGLGRWIRRGIRWTIILGIWGVIALAGVVAFFAMQLPSTADWSVPKRPPNIKILANDGSLIANRGDTGGEAVRLDELPPYLPQAVIAIEDRRFYSHFGVDPIGLLRAAYTNFRAGDVVQGGSTLTQQLAKNLFLKPERTFERKLQEAIMAVWLEARYSKQQIIEAYLNRVYLGAGAYGVDAAARRYFGKSARDVSLKEAAILAGLLKAPSRYAPTSDPDAANRRANVVLGAMQEAGFIKAADVKKAAAITVTPKDDGTGGGANYVADWVADVVPDVVGALEEDVVVETTIDPHLQEAAGKALTEALDKNGKAYNVSQGALVAIDGTGAVRALVGGRDYQKSQFNRAVAAKRQPGSAFKPFVYLTALEYGLTPETVRVDEPIKIGNWEPKNYEKSFKGPVTLQSALALSINTIAVQLANEVGPARVVETAKRLGITSPLQANPSIALGTSEVTPLELADAFVPFANGGFAVPPQVITRVKSVQGKTLYERPGTKASQVIDSTLVGMMNSMMQQTLERGTGRKASIAGWPAAGKTGTTNDSRDAWFVGYTANLTAAVWLGNDDFKPTKRMTGGSVPAAIWNRFMTEAHKGVPVTNLPGSYTFRDPNAFRPDMTPQQEVNRDGLSDYDANGQLIDPSAPRRADGAGNGGYDDPEASWGDREVPPPPGEEGYYPPPEDIVPPRRSRDPYADDRYAPVPPADVGSGGYYEQSPPPRRRGNFLEQLFGR